MTENSREEPTDTDARRRVRDQIRLIREASKGRIAWHSDDEPRSEDEADFTFLCDADHVLVRNENVAALRGALERLQDDFDGVGDSVGNPIEGLTRYLLPPRRDDRPRTVPETLDRIEEVTGRPGPATRTTSSTSHRPQAAARRQSRRRPACPGLGHLPLATPTPVSGRGSPLSTRAGTHPPRLIPPRRG